MSLQKFIRIHMFASFAGVKHYFSISNYFNFYEIKLSTKPCHAWTLCCVWTVWSVIFRDVFLDTSFVPLSSRHFPINLSSSGYLTTCHPAYYIMLSFFSFCFRHICIGSKLVQTKTFLIETQQTSVTFFTHRPRRFRASVDRSRWKNSHISSVCAPDALTICGFLKFH